MTLTLPLNACFLVGAAAGAAGIAVVYDHRKVEAVLDDQRMANSVTNQIKSHPALDNDSTHINVTCFNGVVLLTGETTSTSLREKAETLTRSIPNITRVYNQITIKGPTSSLSQASDAWITAKIKSIMLTTKDLRSGTIKVVTENGAVYLMGLVTHDQADITVDIARQVDGVQKVVKIFQYKN